MKHLAFLRIGLTMLISLTACSQAAPIGLTDTASSVQTHIAPSLISSPKPITESLPSPTVTSTAQPTATATIEVIPTDTPKLPSSTSNPTQTEAIEVFPTEAPWPTDTPIPGLETGASITLTALTMFDETTGWGVESTSHIMRTTDGGSSWQDVTPPQGQLYREGGFFALDAGTAWAVPWLCSSFCYPPPKTTFVWRTSDGGQTWQPSQLLQLLNEEVVEITYSLPIAMQFLNPLAGWLLVETDRYMNGSTIELFRTTDGGLTWEQYMAHHAWCSSIGIAFVDAETGWIGENCLLEGIAMAPLVELPDRWDSALLMVPKMPNADRPDVNWQEYTPLPLPKSMLDEFSQPEAAQVNGDCGVTKLSSISPQVVGVEWQCRTYMTDPTKYFTYYYITPDGGQSWYSWKSTGNESFFNADMGWRLYSPDPAQLSQLQKTTDGGLDWVNIKEVAWQSARFEFISEQVGWAIVSIGDVTALLRTNDGGKTWVVLK